MTVRRPLLRSAAAVLLAPAIVAVGGCSLRAEDEAETTQTRTGTEARQQAKARRAPPVRPDPPSYALNPGFEAGVDFWGPIGKNRLERVTDVKKFGRASAKAVASASPRQPYGARSLGLIGYPRRGQLLTFSVWIRGDPTTVGKAVKLLLTETGGGAPAGVVAAKGFLLSSGWERVAIRGRVKRDDRASIDVYLIVDRSIGYEDSFYFDGVRLEDERAGRDVETSDTTASSR